MMRMSETKEELEARLRHGTGKDRRTITEQLKDRDFVGWHKILALANETANTVYWMTVPNFSRVHGTDAESLRENLRLRDRALVSALFLTGGRVSEVLALRKRNFRLVDYAGERFIRVSNMPLFKGHERREEVVHVTDVAPKASERQEGLKYRWDQETGKFEGVKYTSRIKLRERNPFPIPMFEPLVADLHNYVKSVDDWLFPSPTKTSSPCHPGVQGWLESQGFENRPFISPARALQIMNSLQKRTGIQVWNHYFRAQRTKQLQRDFEMESQLINRYMGWITRSKETFQLYGGTGFYGLCDRFIKFRHSHELKLTADMASPLED